MSALANLREGSLSARNFIYKERYDRMMKLKIAKHISFERSETDGVLSLDIECVDDRYLLCGSRNGAVVIYDLANSSGKLPFKCELVAQTNQESMNAIVKVQWFPFDTGIFITSNKCKSVKVWDANTLTVEKEFVLPQYISSHDLSSCASQHTLIAVATTSPTILLADMRSTLCIQELRGLQKSASSVAWSPKYEHLLAAGDVDGKINLWDIRSSRGVLKCLSQHNKMDKKSILPSAHDYPVTALKFTTDGLHLVSQGSDNNIKLWNADTFENVIVNYATQRDTAKKGSAGFPPKTFEVCCNLSQPLLFVPNKNDLQVFDLHTGTEHETVLGSFQRIQCIGYRASAQELYSGGAYGTGRLLAWSSEVDEEVEKEYMSQIKDPSSPYRSNVLTDGDGLSDID